MENNGNKTDLHDHNHDEELQSEKTVWKTHWDLLLALFILIVLLTLEYAFKIKLP